MTCTCGSCYEARLYQKRSLLFYSSNKQLQTHFWTLSPVKCALSRLEAKAVSQDCAWSKNVLKMTFSLVTTCVSVTLFLSPENKAYLFAQRFNVISVCHKTKCGIDEDIPQYQLAFDYLADKNSSVNEKESKMKKLTEITMQLIFP